MNKLFSFIYDSRYRAFVNVSSFLITLLALFCVVNLDITIAFKIAALLFIAILLIEQAIFASAPFVPAKSIDIIVTVALKTTRRRSLVIPMYALSTSVCVLAAVYLGYMDIFWIIRALGVAAIFVIAFDNTFSLYMRFVAMTMSDDEE